jgi:hypothetical protein
MIQISRVGECGASARFRDNRAGKGEAELVRRFLGSFLWLGVLVAIGVPSMAAAVTITDCDSCYGSEYTLTVADLGGGTLEATLQIDTSGFTGLPTADSISHVEFKVASEVLWLDPASAPTLTSAPTDLAHWVTMAGPLSNGGCGGVSDGFVCSYADDPAYFAPVGGTLSWQWEFMLPEGVALSFPEEGHIGAKYNNSVEVMLGSQLLAPGTLDGWITSAPIPEPTSTVLFAAGALVIGGAMRRKLLS